jgi:hypothetical protein
MTPNELVLHGHRIGYRMVHAENPRLHKAFLTVGQRNVPSASRSATGARGRHLTRRPGVSLGVTNS